MSTGPVPARIAMTLDAVGGVWRYAMDLATALRPLGVSTVFAAFGPEPSASQRAEANRIGKLVWLEGPLDWLTEDEAPLDRIPAQLERLVRDERIDLLQLNLPSQAAGLRVACPVVVVSHSCVVTWFRAVRGTGLPADWTWQQRRNGAGFDAADAVVSPSASHAAMLRECYGPIRDLRVVHNAVATDVTLAPKADEIFAAGRWWDEGKNGTVLDKAAADVSWPVVMAGPLRGPNGQSVAIHHAEALGEVPNSEVRARMARAAVFVSPSVYEPFGLAPLEAARSRAALVLADIPTYRELWDGVAEFAAPRDPRAFAAAIDRLISNPELRADFAERAAIRAEQFSPAVQADAMLAVYKEAAERAASALPASEV